MALFRKHKKRSTITREQALACTPVRNETVSWTQLPSGLVQLEYVLMLKPFLLTIFERFSSSQAEKPKRTLELDELGTEVWQMLDGSRTTADIIKEFAAHHGISSHEAEHSITLFLRALGKRGLIALR